MAWSEIDLNRSLWQIPGARTKNHRTHVVPLPPMALAIIREVPHRKDNDYLFGEAGFNGWSHAKHYLDARIAEERRKAGNLEPMPAWWLHDLRRTCATVMADRLGIQPHIVEAVLNHVSGHKAGVAGTYNRAPYAAEKRTALSLWAEHVRTIIEDGERKVVPFREASSIPA